MRLHLTSFLLLVSCGAILGQSKHKLNLYGTKAGDDPKIIADAKTGQEFNADVHSQTNIDSNAISASGSKTSWNVGAGGNNANAGSATASKNGNDLTAVGKTGQSRVRINGKNSANLTAPGNRQMRVNASQTSETAVDNTGRAWSANKTGSNKWTARGAAGKTASIDNINNAQNIQLTGPAGKQYVASQTSSGATSGNAQIRESAGINSWKADQADTGTGKGIGKTTVYKNGIPVYSSSVDKDRQAVILTDPTGRVNIAECDMDEYKDNYCPELAFNNKFDTKDEFRIDNKSVIVSLVPKVNETGHLEYEFPGCFDIAMTMVLAPGVQAKDFVAQLSVSMPDGLTFNCPEAYNCAPLNCIYTKLCAPYNQQPTPSKNAVNWGFSASDNNVCTSQSGRNLPFKARVCPPNATYTADPKYQAFTKQLNLFGSVKSDIQVTMKLFSLKQGTSINGCPDAWINSKLDLIGCRQGTVSYTVKVFGQEFLSAQGAFDKLLQGQGLFGSQTTKAPSSGGTATSASWFNQFASLLGGGK